ncbi:hypothetical protein HN51_007898 [Arachis hypogaea]
MEMELRYTETLDQKSDIMVPENDHGLYTIDILDPSLFTKCIHLTEVYHFHDMIDMLVGCGYKKGTTLLGYGYDFRQSNRKLIPFGITMCLIFAGVGKIDKLMDGLKTKLETAYKATGGRKVNLLLFFVDVQGGRSWFSGSESLLDNNFFKHLQLGMGLFTSN